MIKRITFDTETRSMCDLKKSGAVKYSLDPTTQVTCLAFKDRNSTRTFLFPFEETTIPWAESKTLLKQIWQNYIGLKYEFSGHNVLFDRAVYNNILVTRYGWPSIPVKRWRCTAAKAAACALPRNLEGAGSAMNLTTQKDKAGFIAMMQTCRPTKQWNAWKKNVEKGKAKLSEEPPVFLEPDKAPDVWNTLYRYCKIDVVTEELLDSALPDLSHVEREIWQLNQQINWRGLNIDTPTVRKIVDIMAVESKTKLKELDSLTMGLVTKAGARQSILEFLALEGIELPDIRAKTVDDVLADGKLSEDMRKLLEIRKALSKTSTKKYQSMLNRAGDDNRVRDILLYHGASTGRDSGTGVQFQNLPRPLISQRSIETILEELQKDADVEWLKVFFGDNLSICFSALLRSMLIPSKGHELFVADFSKIEVAVLWWLADNTPGLKVLNSGKDPYKYQAMANTGKKYDEITEDERQLGKAQILGGGFGMGKDKFQSTAWDMYRLKLTEAQSKQAIDNYRTANAAVPVMWKAYEQAAVAAIENPGGRYTTNKCTFQVERGFLWITLPSGRKLAYRKPCLVWKETEYGPRRSIEFLGLALSKKVLAPERTWGGTLTENVVQAVARDLMMQAMVGLEKRGYKALLSVHDEAITEKKIGEGDLTEFKNIMCKRPSWADAKLPLDAKAWQSDRYRK